MINKFLSELKYFILKIITFIISKICSTKNIIIFESSSDFCDNSRALFDYMIENKINEKYEIIWFVQNDLTISKYRKKYFNVKFKKLSYSLNIFTKTFWVMMYYFSVAKFVFYTHNFIGGEGNKKQKRMNLTHGALPIKQCKDFFGSQKHNTEISIISEYAGYYYNMVFNEASDHYKILGNPRNDKLFVNDKNVDKIIPNNKYDKIILWLPTFKHINNNSRNDYKDNSDHDISILSDKNIEAINEVLKENNMLLILKFHPAQNMNYVPNLKKSNFITIDNKKLFDNDIQLHSLIGACDGFITDFSSVYYDFLLCNKPIAFELCDMEKYDKGIGFVFENPLEHMIGYKIFNVDDLINFLNDISNDKDKYSKERKKLTDLCHRYKDGNSSKRIVEYYNLDK